MRTLEITCSNCGTISLIRYAIMPAEPPKCEDCDYRKSHFAETKESLGLKQDTKVMRFSIDEYFLRHLEMSEEFFKWFATQPHGPTVKLSEVLDAYARFRKRSLP